MDLGCIYRLTDFQSALGISQLGKLDAWVARRQAIACSYDESFAGSEDVTSLAVRPHVLHAYHLYVIRIEPERLLGGWADLYRGLRDERIGVNVHYTPVHLHPYHSSERLGTVRGWWPNAEGAYGRILTLRMFPRITDTDVETVVRAVNRVLQRLAA